ncbi:MAG: D-glycerate dehydrogenase [Dehalococcoidia bacterium]|nr:D-glycerate dehydrogenase [Dehalococcoidia bacterium]MDW8119152.1 D-glycerate dehydrogenase [Chloroflexota bacterium]
MQRPKVYVTRRLFPEVVQRLAQECQVSVWDSDTPVPRPVLLREARDCDGLLTLLTERIDKELMDGAPRLRVVSNMAVGYDNIDIPEATRRGILVGHTPRVLTKTTADFAWALLMAAARLVVQGDRDVRQGKWRTWEPLGWLGQDVHGATLGIVGLGQIGLEVAKRAQGFEMRILYYDSVRRSPEEEARYRLEYVPTLEALLPQCDFVTLHTPLTPQTYHLIGAPQLRLMKPTAVLVNTSRGKVVDQKALYEALRDGIIWAAALDVTEEEPIPPNDPLLTLPNCIITPHIASASFATRKAMANLAVANLLAGLKGQPMPACVNPEAGQRQPG